MKRLTLPAVAKLNLFLHITGRRPDGYHNLQTLFQLLDVGDELSFTLRHDNHIALHCNNSELINEQNLVLRAARLLQQHSKCTQGCDIYLAKRLPMGGGLGGGSSDAATTLVALNQLWNTQLSHDELAAIGLKLGADIPVFIHGFAAFAEGVGERLQTVNPAELWYLIIAPDAHVSTAAVFQDPQLPRNTPKLGIDTLLSQSWRNDCQELVVSKYPQVAKALGWLLEYAPSRMTGTGACVFGEFSSQQQALAALAKLPSDMQGFVAKGMNISPLIVRLNRP